MGVVQPNIMISIVIVNWNTREDLRRCLESIALTTAPEHYEVFVVDNASADGSADMVRTSFPNVHLIANPQNLGFARANNQAIREARGEWVLLLNPDAILEKNSLSAVLTCAQRHPDAGIVSCQLRNANGSVQRSVRRFPGLGSQLLIILKLHKILRKSRVLSRYFADDLDYNREQEVEQPAGAFLFVAAAVFKKVGLLDERYWIWFEDVDFCMRAVDAGFKIWYTPDGWLTHVGGVAFAKSIGVKKQWYLQVSMMRYFWRHKPYWHMLPLALAFPFGLFLAGLVQLFGLQRATYDYHKTS